MRLFFSCLLICLGFYTVTAQTLTEKMRWYDLAKPSSNLFVHFDKNVYANNETAYFTGYLIKGGRTPINQHQVMAVALIRDADSAVILEDKFLFNKGLSFGSILIPDSILTGSYHFLAYTNRLLNGIPEALFIQRVTLKTNIDPPFKANLKIVTAMPDITDDRQVLVSVTSKDDGFLPKAATIHYQYGKLSKKTITDASGQLLIRLPSQSAMSDPNLYVKLKYGRDSSFIKLAIPQVKHRAVVKFYPEGGNLVNGLTSIVSWEVKDDQNLPLALNAFLYKDQQIIDTLVTSSYGIGKFKLTPQPGANYTVRLIHSALTDTVYNLPAALNNGLVLTVAQALAQDTLKFTLKSNNLLRFTIMAHNFREVYVNAALEMSRNGTIVKIPLQDVPKGLTTLTVTDSLNRPLAERMFFAHYENNEKINITTDKQVYKPREKVNLKLQLTAGKDALVSIAAVQQNRLELKNTNDIESYTYLTNELNDLPLAGNGNALKDTAYLEQVLAVKGWRKYNWHELNTVSFSDTLASFDSLSINGQVVRARKDKEITKPVTVGLMGNLQATLITTTASGSFNLSVKDLIAAAERKIYLFVVNKNKLAFSAKILVDDEYTNLNKKLSALIKPWQFILPSGLQNNMDLVLKNNERAIRLKEVVISGKKDNNINYMGANACGDYVCPYNILNCKNHIADPRNKQPVAGKTYLRDGMSIVYAGCEIPDLNLFFEVKGIHLEKEFYLNDYKDPVEPAFFSTAYWNYATLLQNGKAAELSFYTSDITGKFKIVVQGINDADVVYAEYFFEVGK